MDRHDSSTDLTRAKIIATDSITQIKADMGKHLHIGNQARAAKAAEEYHNDASCPLCGQADSQQHWITQCQASKQDETTKLKERREQDITGQLHGSEISARYSSHTPSRG